MNTCQDACNKVFLYLLQETVTAKKKQKNQNKNKTKQHKKLRKKNDNLYF